MKFRQALAILVLTSGVGACATYYSDGVQYDDGSYYSPADEGEGDYYFAPQPRYYHHYDYHYDWFFGWPYYHGPYGSWYGSPFYRYDGYCSVGYRYCPSNGYYDSFPYFGLTIQFYDPWIYGRQYRDGDGYGYGDGYNLGYGYGRGHGHGHRRGDGDRRGPPRARRPDAPSATPTQPGEDASAGRTPPDQDWNDRQDEPSPQPRRLPRRDPRADLTIDEPVRTEPVATVAVEASEASETPGRRWRSPPRPAASAPVTRTKAPAPAPVTRSAAPERSTSNSEGESEKAPRVSRRARDADDRN